MWSAALIAFSLVQLGRAACLPELKSTEDWASLKAEWTSPTSGNSAMPLGNGRMGIKVNGAIANEIYQLNDNTFWSGDPELQLQFNNGTGPETSIPVTNASVRKNAYEATLEAVKAAYKEGNTLAQQVGNLSAADSAALKMWGPFQTTSSFLPVGNLEISVSNTRGYKDYKRTLDLDGARTVVQYTVGETIFTRESFVSHADQVMVIKMNSSDATPITATIKLTLPSQQTTATYEEDGSPVENRVTVDPSTEEVVLKARGPYYKSRTAGNDRWSKTRGLTMEARVRVLGNAGANITKNTGDITISAPEIVLVYRSATSYVDPFTNPSGPNAAKPGEIVQSSITAAVSKGADLLLNDHQTDFRNEFRRLWIDLDGSNIASIDDTVDMTPTAYALHYQYTRYQLLSASRESSLDRPNALQGIWSNTWNPTNEGSYFLNENVEKMYAAMEMQNIPNSGWPLWRWIRNLATNGKISAAGDFGFDDGSWSTAHYSDIWVATTLRGGLNPVDQRSNSFVIWPYGGIWLMNQIYDSYMYSGNASFLNENWDIIEGAARFAINSLATIDGLKGELKNYYSIPVSTSPEHPYIADGKTRAVDANAACEIELFHNIFNIIVDGAERMAAAGYGINNTFISTVKTANSKLVPLNSLIRNSTLKEFYTFEGSDPTHRHASHLLMSFPLHYTGFDQKTDPTLYKAAQQAYLDRGGASNAWHPDGGTSGIRLGYASDALRNPKHGLFNTFGKEYHQWGAMGACVGEAILDSSNGELNILPFMPKEWSSGRIVGARARGGYELSIEWSDGNLKSAVIDVKKGGSIPSNVRVRGDGVNPTTDSRFTINQSC